MQEKDRYLVTAALPYANGPVHVGHAIGAYVPADVYVRYRRLRGDDVLYICGTDEHGTPITVTADKEGITPQQVVDKYHKSQLEAFESIGVRFDNFSGTARPVHHKLSQKFFTAINDKGFIYKKTVERPYCPSCRKFLPDRYVRGVCPNCKSEDQRGDQCEACGKQLEPHELLNSYCSICRTPPEQRETTHWFFKLSGFSEPLRQWIERDCGHWPANARNFALGWIREGLQDRAITRDLSWGVPVPVEGADGKVLYVWFDAPIGYISATIEWAQKSGKPDEWRKYWTKPTKIVHFIGKDNIPFHTIIWPAILIAEGSFALPWQIASNEFLNLEGRKVSTSRNWVIWLHDITREFNPDAVRYYLIANAPETHDADFSLTEFKDTVNNEFVATYANLVNRILTFIKNKKDSVVPKPDEKAFDDLDQQVKDEIAKTSDAVGESIENLKLAQALAQVNQLAAFGNTYFQRKEPWKQENENTLYLCTNLVRSLAIIAAPLLPKTSEAIWRQLNLPDSVHKQKWEDAKKFAVSGGHKIGEVSILVEKIDDKKIEEFRSKYLLLGEKKGEKMAEVDYTEFGKLDLRVGEVTSVDDHPNADKLYILDVDLGSLGKRTLVAGIKASYSKEELVGRKIIVVANLKPVKIRGVESRGMLLVADVEGRPVFLAPEKDAPAGSKVL